MSKYGRVIREVVKKSFPLLENHRIFVIRFPFIYGIRVVYLYFFTLFIYGKGGSKKRVNRGSVAHELSHIEMFRKWGFWKSFLLSISQYFSRNIRRKIERGADKLAIERGYGKELYIARKRTLDKASERIKKLVKTYYLSLNEIRKLSK